MNFKGLHSRKFLKFWIKSLNSSDDINEYRIKWDNKKSHSKSLFASKFWYTYNSVIKILNSNLGSDVFKYRIIRLSTNISSIKSSQFKKIWSNYIRITVKILDFRNWTSYTIWLCYHSYLFDYSVKPPAVSADEFILF